MIRQKKIVIFFGPPGCGKGTQSVIVSKKLGFHVIATGDILRLHAKDSSSPFFAELSCMSQGKLVANNVVTSIMTKELISTEYDKIILDGYPRSLEQAKTLENFEDNMIVVHFGIDFSQLTCRIENRVLCGECGYPTCVDDLSSFKCANCGSTGSYNRRSDDNVGALEKRVNEYKEKTVPLLEYYYGRGVRVVDVDASMSIDDVSHKLLSIL